jgi:hypothetical protein
MMLQIGRTVGCSLLTAYLSLATHWKWVPSASSFSPSLPYPGFGFGCGGCKGLPAHLYIGACVLSKWHEKPKGEVLLYFFLLPFGVYFCAAAVSKRCRDCVNSSTALMYVPSGCCSAILNGGQGSSKL